VSVAGNQVRANMLLCDGAQVVGDKLYILGGGWSYVWLANEQGTVGFAAAIDLIVPWDFANRTLKLVLRIVTEDFEDVIPEGADGPVQQEGNLVVGRAPQARPGADIHVPLVIPFAPLQLEPGGYVCELLIDSESVNRAGFQVNLLNASQG
jgi:hypothetical protein